MGCLSSKLVMRSMSFRGELNKSMQRSPNCLTAPEDLATSKTINDQLLALVHTSSKVASKLGSGSFSKSSPESAVEHNSSLTKDTWEFSSSLEQEEQEKQEKHAALVMPESQRDDRGERSKCRHLFPEDSSLESFDGIIEERFNDKGITRDRSFHTVEEYDAMLEKIRLSIAEQTGSDGKEAWSNTTVQLNASYSSSLLSNHEMDDKEIQQSHSKDEASPEGNSETEETIVSSGAKQESRTHAANPNGSNATEGLDVARHFSARHNLEKGLKRRSIAKALDSLEIPQSIEFQTVASLREWLHAGGQIYSPGSYVTPKFGNHALPNSQTESECGDTVVFSPELVAALEECMQQLEVDAETILKQMAENSVEESLMKS